MASRNSRIRAKLRDEVEVFESDIWDSPVESSILAECEESESRTYFGQIASNLSDWS